MCDEDIKHQLHALPEGLEDIYLQCLKRIHTTNDKRSSEVAPRVFKWIASAKRPLSQAQIQEAVSLRVDDVPLRKSMVLSTPVQDYCANLVVLDKQTGTVIFPHPTVKEFLQDRTKVPHELHKYLLSANADDLWCGELCLAYAHYLHSRKKLVTYDTQRIDANVAVPILKSVPAGWLANLWLKPSGRTPEVRMPLSRLARQPVAETFDLQLHDYICRHWLTHNLHITSDHSAFSTFAELCLSHDAELQPWATSPGNGVEYYQNLVEYAIMTKNTALLKVGKEHILSSTKTTVRKIFNNPCPGTDSTWLHVCAALGHTDTVRVLKDVCSSRIANGQGKSAAAVAAENGHIDTFYELTNGELSYTPVWSLRNFGDQRVQENILRVCASCGNILGMEVVLDMLRRTPMGGHPPNIENSTNLVAFGGYYSDAFFHAIHYGHIGAALYLGPYCADSTYLDLLESERSYYETTFNLSTLQGDLITIALHLGNARFLDTVLNLNTDQNLLSRIDANRVLAQFGDDHKLAEGFLVVLAKHKLIMPPLYRQLGNASSWIETPLKHLLQGNFASSKWWNKVLRLMIEGYTVQCTGELSAMCEVLIPQSDVLKGDLKWLKRVSDDNFVRMVKSKWLKKDYMFQLGCLRALTERPTSRALEQVLMCLQFDPLVADQALKGRPDRGLAIGLCDFLEMSACHEDRCVKVIARATDRLSNDQVGREERDRVYYSTLLHGIMQHQHMCPKLSYSYKTNLIDMMARAAECGRQQVLEMLLCYWLPPSVMFDSSGNRRTHLDLLSAIGIDKTIFTYHLYQKRLHGGGPSAVMWLRCFKATRDYEKADLLKQRLLKAGSDGNRGLNFPAGYEVSIYATPSAKTEEVKFSIRADVRLAVHAWSFRLNRRRRNKLSQSDLWYISLLLCLKFRHLRVRRSAGVVQ